MSFWRSDKFKSLYKCVQAFEIIRSKKGCQNLFQKHDLLQTNWKFACDLGFAGTNFSRHNSTLLAAPGSPWPLLAAPGSSWQLLAASRSYKAHFFWDFCPWRAFLAAPGSSWQLLAAPRGRKIVITRRSGQLQSSYFACADLWTCWIRFWYSRSPKLTKMICCWWFSFLFFYIWEFFFCWALPFGHQISARLSWHTPSGRRCHGTRGRGTRCCGTRGRGKSCAGIKTRFKALLKTQYLTLGPNF